MTIHVIRADYQNSDHGRQLLDLLNVYACDPMGGGAPLPSGTRETLLPALQKQPGAFSLIAYSDDAPAGLANCFVGFSTFAAKPLINIHDIVVDPAYRGQGIAKALFREIETIAASMGACKVTLEVLSGNAPAKALYTSLGYGDYALDPETGTALFWQKRLVA